MTDTIVILTEETIEPDDARRILDVHTDETDLRYVVIVPQESGRGLLASVLNDLSLLDFSAMMDDLRGEERSAEQVAADADERLAVTLESLRSEGGTDVQGFVTAEPPLTALGQVVERERPRELIVLTRPHAVEDTFRTDWASVARDTLGLPVLHLYGGTGYVG